MKTHSGKFLVIAALCLASSGSLAEPLGCSFKDYSDTYKRDRAAFRALVIECEGSEKAASEEGRKSTQRFMDALNNIGRRGTSRASNSEKRNSSSGSRDPNAPYLTDTNPVIGGVMCSYSDGSVVKRRNKNTCPRRMGDSF